MWNPREDSNPYIQEHLLKKFASEAAAEEIIRISIVEGVDKETMDRVVQAVEVAVRGAVALAFPAPARGRRRSANDTESWLWDVLEERLGTIEMLMLRNQFEAQKKQATSAQRAKKRKATQQQKTKQQLQTYLRRFAGRITSRVYDALLADLAKARGSRLAGLTPATFVRELGKHDGGVVGKVDGIGPRALSELREMFEGE